MKSLKEGMLFKNQKLQKIVTNLADTWEYLNIEEQQKTLLMIINNITIYDNNINIDFK